MQRQWQALGITVEIEAIDPVQFPRLAGQHGEYTLAELKKFRSGERTNDAAKMMRVIATKMTDQEMAAVAEYISGLN